MSNTTEGSLLKPDLMSPIASQSPISLKENALSIRRESMATLRTMNEANYYYHQLSGTHQSSQGRNQQSPQTQDRHNQQHRHEYIPAESVSSIGSSSHLIWMKKNVFTRLRLILKTIGALLTLGFVLQTGFFGVLLQAIDMDCKATRTVAFTIESFGILGIIFSLWIALADLIIAAQRCLPTAIIGTCVLTSHVAILLTFIFTESQAELTRCIKEQDLMDFLSFYILLASMTIVLSGTISCVYFLWKLVYNHRMAQELEQIEEKKVDLLHQAARGLDVS